MAILNKNIRQMIFCKIERSMYRVVWISDEITHNASYTDGVLPFRPDNVEAVRTRGGKGRWYPIIEELPMDKKNILVKYNCHYLANKWRFIRLNSEKDIPVYFGIEKEIRELEKEIEELTEKTGILRQKREIFIDYSVDYNTVPYEYKKN